MTTATAAPGTTTGGAGTSPGAGAAGAPSAPRLSLLSGLLADWQTEAQAAHDAYTSGRPRGAQTGIGKLDDALGHLAAGTVHYLHGEPGTGKTALALQVATSCGCPALFITCEMGDLELFRRIVARLTGTFLGKLRSGELPPGQSLRLAQTAAAQAPQLAIADATTAHADPAWIATAAQGTRARLGQGQPHLLIVIDSIHSWSRGAYPALAEYDALASALDDVRQLAHQTDAAVLGILERTKYQMAAGGLHAGAGHRGFAYSAESVWDLAVDDRGASAPGRPLPAHETALTLKLPKNRSGVPGAQIPLLFTGRTQAFREA